MDVFSFDPHNNIGESNFVDIQGQTSKQNFQQSEKKEKKTKDKVIDIPKEIGLFLLFFGTPAFSG